MSTSHYLVKEYETITQTRYTVKISHPLVELAAEIAVTYNIPTQLEDAGLVPEIFH
ncbi:hypothetical protein VAEKB19_430004 [Vibrio aestuarianus]|nr:hypothetical protein VAEKB19_430004 [Vibrio aestuarianus]